MDIQENRKNLLKALRSGAYQQTTSQLRDSTGFCCLGVACAVSDLGYWEGHEYVLPDRDSSKFILPVAVQQFYYFNDPNPRVTVMGGTTLATLNDQGFTFDLIADLLAKEWNL